MKIETFLLEDRFCATNCVKSDEKMTWLSVVSFFTQAVLERGEWEEQIISHFLLL
jgi:hypothetical protein